MAFQLSKRRCILQYMTPHNWFLHRLGRRPGMNLGLNNGGYLAWSLRFSRAGGDGEDEHLIGGISDLRRARAASHVK